MSDIMPSNLIDTHCHLNFKAFEGGQKKIIRRAREVGVYRFVVPGTDIETSKKACSLSHENEEVYAAVGIHPHHALPYENQERDMGKDLEELAVLLQDPKVVAVGEVGLDRHVYYQSRHGDGIEISSRLFEIQKQLFIEQARLAAYLGKALIVHNREAKDDLVNVFINEIDALVRGLDGRVVLHCCEAERELFELMERYHGYIGIDGDITYSKQKQDFIAKAVPLDMLVLETDSPYILPEPLKSQKKYPNTPASLIFVAQEVARCKGVSFEQVVEQTTQNAKKLFGMKS